MSELLKKIEKALKDDALTESLKTEALGELTDALRKSEILLADQEETIEALSNERSELKRQLEQLESKHQTLKRDAGDLTKRRQAITAKEMEHALREQALEYEQKRVDDHIQMFGRVFRNVQVRERAYGQVPVAVDGAPGFTDQYGASCPPVSGAVMAGYMDKIITKEEE